MKHAKSSGGAEGSGVDITGILTNYEVYQHWVRNTHERTRYVDATFNMSDMLSQSLEGAKCKDVQL